MSEAKRNNNFNKKQLRGLEMVVKSASKKYHFIKGWEFGSDYEKWSTSLYLNLLVDIFELADFLDLKVKDYYRDNLNQINTASLSPYLIDKDVTNEYEYNYEMTERIFDKTYNLRKKITEYLNSLYGKLPEEYQITYTLTFNFGVSDIITELSVDAFKQYNV